MIGEPEGEIDVFNPSAPARYMALFQTDERQGRCAGDWRAAPSQARQPILHKDANRLNLSYPPFAIRARDQD
jgi:hypothetical protein